MAAAAVSLGLLAAAPLTSPAVAAGSQPNIVIILTDDQAEGTMDAMPITHAQIAEKGVVIRDGVIPTSTCCPSRSALLSAQYARTTDVYMNVGHHGGWGTFNAGGTESHTIAVALHDAGYRTGLFGKYLNGFSAADPGYVPPGWDQFRAIWDPNGKPALSAGAYYDYYLQGTGQDVFYGHTEADYSTDVVAAESINFINDTPADQPLFLYFASSGPHAPFTPAPRHIGTWHDEPLSPAATQLTEGRPDFMPDALLDYDREQADLRSQHEALMSVDEAVGGIIDALGTRADNTLFVFLSDNGLQFGEHGLNKKYVPYSGSTDVPMLLRWDGTITPGSTYRDAPVTNADLGATVADAAGVSLVDPDGVSFFSSGRPASVPLEALDNREHPSYCGIRTRRYAYIEYDADAGEELYDYRVDPYELDNKANDASYDGVEANLRDKAKHACHPRPPGFNWELR